MSDRYKQALIHLLCGRPFVVWAKQARMRLPFGYSVYVRLTKERRLGL